MKFSKMHGAGNDYVYVDCTKQPLENASDIAIKVSDRHKGIGSDGLVLIETSDKADFFMRMYNADGSEGSMCGNAIRCVAKYVYDNGLTDKLALDIDTKSGVKYLKLYLQDGKVDSVQVDMGNAYWHPNEIPVINDTDSFVNSVLTVDNKQYNVTCLSVGNPHCVVFMNDAQNKANLVHELDKLDLDKIGPHFENHPMFPERMNTEFVEIIDDKTLKMRVYERGSGETMACGTGATAVVAAAVRNGICKHDQEIDVILRGGTLSIVYKSDGSLLMRGEAVHVFNGEIEI